jgi:hypothetical protein
MGAPDGYLKDNQEDRVPNADNPPTNDLDIEVSGLRERDQLGGVPEHDIGPTPWHRQRVPIPRPLVVAALVVMMGLMLLAAPPIGATLRALVPQPTPTTAIVQVVYPTSPAAIVTPSPYPTPTLIAPAVGPVPANCPPSARLVDFAPTATIPGVGGSEVWLIGFVGPGGDPETGQRATAKIGAAQRIIASYTAEGWPFEVQALARSDFAQTVTITGYDLRTNYNLWFSPETNSRNTVVQTAPVLTIDFSQSTASSSDGQWKIWFGVLYLPGAGCYTLHTNWPGGGWDVNFAAGQ